MAETIGDTESRKGLEAVLEAIEGRQRFLVTSHARPDGDAIGSVLACAMMLQRMGKEAEMVLFDRVPLIYRTLPGAERVRQSAAIPERHGRGEPDAVILLECDGIERSRLGGLEGRFLINIDHHTSGRNFAHVNWIDPAASAVGEMIYRLAIATGVEIVPELATCVYAAVLTDTGSFSYEGTAAETFALAEELVRRGAEPVKIAQDIYYSNPASKMRLLGRALRNLHREGRIAWMWVTQADMARADAAEEDCEGLVNYAIGISGVEVAVFLRELPNQQFRLSIRSKGEVNVALVAERFSGGGHENASGCTLDGPLASATERILYELRAQVRQDIRPERRGMRQHMEL